MIHDSEEKHPHISQFLEGVKYTNPYKFSKEGKIWKKDDMIKSHRGIFFHETKYQITVKI